MESNKVELRTPKFEELYYRKKLLADRETMTYNIGYGKIYGTGCIEFNESDWKDWFALWI